MTHPSFDLIKTIVETTGLAAPQAPSKGMSPQDHMLAWRESLEELTKDAVPPEGVQLTTLRIGSMAVDLLTPVGSGLPSSSDSNEEYPSIDLAGPVIVYLHGGGFCAGSRNTHRDIAGRLARTANLATLVPEYPLAPESPFPTAIEALSDFFEDLGSHGIQPHDVIVAGDSAGGGLCVATMMNLRDQGLQLPRGAVLLSPWLDLTVSDPRMVDLDGNDPLIGLFAVRTGASVYAQPEELQNPLASPLFGDLANLPPMQIHVGTIEVLYPDSLRLHEAVTNVGGRSELFEYEGLTHVFQLLPEEIVPETADSLERAGSFIQSLLVESEPS